LALLQNNMRHSRWVRKKRDQEAQDDEEERGDRTIRAKRVPMHARTPSPKGSHPCCGHSAASLVPSKKRSGRNRSGSCLTAKTVKYVGQRM
jgi:hypothetical protein